MRDITEPLQRWLEESAPFSIATVISTHDSTPRPAGTTMAVSLDGVVAGNVSGGCVESAVVEQAKTVLAGGAPRLVTYGISDEAALSVGLTCGGAVDVFVNRIDEAKFATIRGVLDRLVADEPVTVATVVAGKASVGAQMAITVDGVFGSLEKEGLDAAVTDEARGLLAHAETTTRRYGPSGERRRDDVLVFLQSFAPKPRMIVFGAIDFAAALVCVGKLLGYHVTVCDARPVFATKERFPEADEVVVAWPHRYVEGALIDQRSILCVLTHDPKFDVPLLEAALQTPAAYIGAMGSRRTHQDRLARLRDRGVDEDAIDRLRSPIGLDLGGRTPAETAVSIAAEIVADQWGGSGRRLTETSGRIHHDVDGAKLLS